MCACLYVPAFPCKVAEDRTYQSEAYLPIYLSKYKMAEGVPKLLFSGGLEVDSALSFIVKVESSGHSTTI